jgi:Uncharacterised nucleotidyltransferase
MLQKLQNNDLILRDIRRVHTDLSLAGEPPNALLSISDELLCYVLSLLREEQPILPDATLDEWSELLAHLQCHHVIPLLYWKIGHLPTELRPPEDICARMREIYLASHVRYLNMERQIREIFDAFKREKISVLVYKGPALASTIHPAYATRPFNDIDLLVKPEEYLKAQEILLQMGYQCQFKRFEMFQELFNSESFVHQNDTIKSFEVDLHWDIFQYHGLKRDNDVSEFFRNKTDIDTPMLEFKTLSRVDALIQAAFHLILHHKEGRRLIWISDIALLARALVYPEDWTVLKKRVTKFKMHLAMENALTLAHMWNGLCVPEEYRSFSKRMPSNRSEQSEIIYAMNKKGPDIRLSGYLDSIRSAPNKIPYLLNFLFPDPDFMRINYPPSRSWLLPWSYVRRWWHWFRKLVQYMFHRWQTSEDRWQRSEIR